MLNIVHVLYFSSKFRLLLDTHYITDKLRHSTFIHKYTNWSSTTLPEIKIHVHNIYLIHKLPNSKPTIVLLTIIEQITSSVAEIEKNFVHFGNNKVQTLPEKKCFEKFFTAQNIKCSFSGISFVNLIVNSPSQWLHCRQFTKLNFHTFFTWNDKRTDICFSPDIIKYTTHVPRKAMDCPWKQINHFRKRFLTGENLIFEGKMFINTKLQHLQT